MTAELSGSHDGHGLRIGIVVARFNKYITSRLLEGARSALSQCGVSDEDVTVAWVPGSFELPLIASKMAASGRYDAVACLGAVIRGETDHYVHIAGQAATGIASAALETGVPVVFGVLTTDTVEQAMDRSGGEECEHVDAPLGSSKPELENSNGPLGGNTGYSAGLSAVETANLIKQLGPS